MRELVLFVLDFGCPFSFGAGAGATIGASVVASTSASAVSAAALGGFAGGVVGSLAGQVVGNVLGVRDGFSLREALSSGLTAATTAGITAGLGGPIAGVNIKDAKALSSGHKALIAASGVIASASANKTVGLPSGFSWRNVAAAAGTTAIGSALNLDDPKGPLAPNNKAGIISETLGGVAHSAINYSIKKGVFNEGSWDFKDVAANAFGSAVGNSIVRALSGPEQLVQSQTDDSFINEIDKSVNSIKNGMQEIEELLNKPFEYEREPIVIGSGGLDERKPPTVVPGIVNSVVGAQGNNSNLEASQIVENAKPSNLVIDLNKNRSFAGVHLNPNDIRQIVKQNESGWGLEVSGNLHTFASTLGLGKRPILGGAAFGGSGLSTLELSPQEVTAIATIIKSASEEGSITDSLFIVGNQGTEAFNNYVSDLIGDYGVSQAFQASNVRNGLDEGLVLSGAGIYAAAKLESKIANTGFLTKVGRGGFSALWNSSDPDPMGLAVAGIISLVGQTMDGISTMLDPHAPFGDRVAAGFGLALELAPLTKFLKLSKISGKFNITSKVPKEVLDGVGPLRASARHPDVNEDILIDASQGLQSRQNTLFDNVVEGVPGGEKNRYLWTVDNRGINTAIESTPFPTPRGNIVHSNISKEASIGGEAWFGSNGSVTINAGSGRFGDGAGITTSQWDAAIKYWENLGYKVNAIPFGKRKI